MNHRSKVGEKLAYIIVGVTALCLIATPAFSPAIVLAGIVGTLGALVTFTLGVRRLPLVILVFSLAPLAGLVMVELAYPRAASGYLVIAPIAAVIAIAVFSDRLLRSPESRVA